MMTAGLTVRFIRYAALAETSPAISYNVDVVLPVCDVRVILVSILVFLDFVVLDAKLIMGEAWWHLEADIP